MAVSSPQIQDLEYLYASNVNVSNFVSVKLSDKENYHLWKTQMLCLMETHDMHGLVDAAFNSPRVSSKKIMKQYDSLLKGWIFGSVSEEVLGTVVNLGSAKGVWDKLKSSYDPILSAEHVQPKRSSQQVIKDAFGTVVDLGSASAKAVLDELRPLYDPISAEHVQPQTTSQQVGVDIESGEDTTSKEVQRELFYATLDGSWRRVKKILKKDNGLVKKVITSYEGTVLHSAVKWGHKDLVEKLLQFIKEDEVKDILEQTDEDGSTALHIAVSVGNKHAMKLLVDKHKDLLTIPDNKGQDPLIKAFNNMQFDTLKYLLKAAVDNKKAEDLVSSQDPEKGANLVVNTITAKQYSTALELINAFPNFAQQNDKVLMAIARTFPSELNYWERAIYPPTVDDKLLEISCSLRDLLAVGGLWGMSMDVVHGHLVLIVPVFTFFGFVYC